MKKYFLTLFVLNCLMILETNSMRISEEKCKIYKKPVTKEEGLGFGGHFISKEPNCPFSFDAIGLVIGGHKAKPGQFPHMAAIGWYEDERVDFKCGGSLISEKFILTAAHCLTDHFMPDIVRLGDLNLNPSVSDSSKPEDFKIKSFKIHENYKYDPRAHDIALIELEKEINITKSSFIRPACLSQNNPATNFDATVIGWGLSKIKKSKHGVIKAHKKSDHLMYARMKSVDRNSCMKAIMTSVSKTNTYNRKLFCAIGYQAIQQNPNKTIKVFTDACQGDSGGPLQVIDEEIKCVYHILGIISHGQECGSERPSFYTNVAYFLDWIEENVWPREY